MLGQEMDDFEVSPDHLSKRVKYLNKTLDHFWKRWTTEYLLELRDSHRYHGRDRTSSEDSIREGDVVLVHCEDRPRGFWRLARVETLKTGSDGRIRSATVRVHSKGTRSIMLNRPLKRLYPLEINCSPNADSEPLNQEECDDDYSDDTRRPTQSRRN